MTQPRRPVIAEAVSTATPLLVGEGGAVPASATDRWRCQPIWDSLYQHASAEQREHLLGLARQQGLLYGHQLPANGSSSHPESRRPSVSHLLNTPTDQLPAIAETTVEIRDQALDEEQRRAVSRALSTPDIFLLAGLPGAGKTRVLVEIIHQLVVRGQRVLLLAASCAPLDHLLQQVAGQADIWAVRCPGPDEALERLPPAIGCLTLTERVRRFREETLVRVRGERTQAEQRRQQTAADEQTLLELRALALEQRQLAADQRRHEEENERLADDVARTAGLENGPAATVLQPHQELLASLDHELSGIRERNDALRQLEIDQSKAIQALRPLVEARRHHRFWTAAWWQAARRGDVVAELAQFEQTREQTHKELDELEAKLDVLGARREETASAFDKAKLQWIEAETTGRRDALKALQEGAESKRIALVQRWQTVCHQLSPDCPHPVSEDVTAVDAALAELRRQADKYDQERDFVDRWTAGMEEFAAQADRHLCEFANVVAATTTALPHDTHFGRRTDFDVLILQEAHAVTESELLTIGARARRWVFVGELDQRTPEPTDNTRGVRRSTVFTRLWRRLHGDPCALPYTWRRDERGLCCRLRQIAPNQQRSLEREPVADRPDIRLHILSLPRTQPILAEVLFPASLPLSAAKQYVYQEVEELAIMPAGTLLRWNETSTQIVLSFAGHGVTGTSAVELEPGIQEGIASAPDNNPANAKAGECYLTSHISFSRKHGWDRPAAEQWIAKRLGLCDTRRTIHLDRLHRMEPQLAETVTLLLSEGVNDAAKQSTLVGHLAHGAADALNSKQSSLVFVPTPALEHGSGNHRPQGRPRWPRSGAGLELELSEACHRDRLPTEIRKLLPQRGVVNFLEAQAIIQVLETAANDHALLDGPRLAVLTLYPVQAELLRLLLARSSIPAALRDRIEVAIASHFAEREADVVLVSLTRSHSRRGISLAERADDLVLVLTRARRKLILFGDLGMLAQCCQANGPVDAARERELVSRLLRHLEQCPTPRLSFASSQGAHA